MRYFKQMKHFSFIAFLLLINITLIYCEDETVEVVEEKIEEVSDSDKAQDEDEPEKVIIYKTPKPIGSSYLLEHFDDYAGFERRWVVSEATKDGAEESLAKYSGKWDVEEAANGLKGDYGLAMKSKANHHAIATKLKRPFLFDNRPFIFQYEVRFQNGQECGGAYVKLFTDSPELDLPQVQDKTPYTIMFGPDKCGTSHKLHFIIRHKNPKNGTIEEKHWKKAGSVSKLEEAIKDKKPHLFTLVITPDNRFDILLDQRSVHKGNLLEDFHPPINPPAEIEDPEDKKPDNWDDREKIPDPNAQKPEDWDENAPAKIPDPNAAKPEDWLDDEPELIPDPNSEKPKDWDEEMDGQWEPPLINNPKCESVGCGEWKAPLISNPNYKGKWKPPMIDNPNYKGKWKPRKIANPDFFEDKHPYKLSPIGGVGFELWTMSDGILFDNVLITDDRVMADHWAEHTWALKKELSDKEGEGIFSRFIRYTNKNPWLWAVYVVAIGLPVVLFIAFCCTSPVSQNKTYAEKKKTDETTYDENAQPSTSGIEKEKTGAKKKGAGDTNASKADEKSANEEDVAENAAEEAEESEEPKVATRRRKARREEQ